MLLLRYFFWALAKALLSLRYRVRVQGWEQLRDLKKPILLLPNHPGYIDPPLVITAFWPALKPRPLLYEGMFRNPVLYPFMRLLEALRVPDLDRPSAEARAQTERAIAGVIDGLRQGRNHLLWPSGRVERDGVERLGAARALAEILRAVPDAEIVLLRTRGVWGSMFSYAATGGPPRLGRCIGRGALILLSNFVYFTPRRRIEMTLARVKRTELPELDRQALNPWLERWYNAPGPEAPTYVPYHFWLGPRTRVYPRAASAVAADPGAVSAAVRHQVAEILEARIGRSLAEAERRPDTPLAQIGLDSLDAAELAVECEHRFGFTGDQAPTTIGQLEALAQGLAERAPPKPPPLEWFRPAADAAPLAILGESIADAFIARALANPRDVAAADDLAGALPYERFLAAARALSRRFSRLPAANVGVMLPASVGCDLAVLTLHLAGKLPVILNWTTGPTHLAHAARTTGLTHVISSRAFIDRLGVEVTGVEWLWLEEARKGIGRFELLRALLAVRWLPGRVRRWAPPADPSQPAVVLFTSGSERAPKAVPLTHANIISDARAGIAHLGLTRAQAMLGFLPAFHSFGLAVTGLMPLLGGMRVVHHPDPTDARGLARKVAAYHPTMLVGTPTFVSHILDRAETGQLASLRLVVVGAEKCPEALYERCAKAAPYAQLLEGYGITECSPVVSVNRPEANRRGSIGRPLPGVSVCTVDPDTEAFLPSGKTGVLWVGGPTVFPGYLAYEGPSPFRERDGKRWFVTGDLVDVDADGFLWFRGRLQRFLKAGGEMVSLPALEEPFSRLFPPTDEGPQAAVEGIEIPGGRRIVLFTTRPISLREANARLWEEGFRGVLRLDEVRRVDRIPVLGTGKTDYKVLRAQIGAPQGSSG
jgi:long-chain-fatty-acid--[acyl-carrier-protein] ligase